MGSRRVFPLSVDASSSSSSVNRSQPPPPKSPVHRPPTGNGSSNELARPPTGGSVGYVGFDRLMMMRQVNAAAATSTATPAANSADEASAAGNHRQRMAAEQQRRTELTLMGKEDYTGTVEGQERLQRQEERSRMREEELLELRLVEAEKEAARKLQREKELDEEKKVKEQYLAKIRAQREQQEREAKEKEIARKVETERKMKALKEAADAKARAEFAAKQLAIEEEARIVREQHQIEGDTVQMQVEDVLGHAMQQGMIAERERLRQIAAEQEEWRLFQEREHEKQREATQLRRAAMAQQYEQDKQRRIQIHKLQKERAAQQLERRELRNRQGQECQGQKDETKLETGAASVSEDAINSSTQDREDTLPISPSNNNEQTLAQNEFKEEISPQKDESSEIKGENNGDHSAADQAAPPGESAPLTQSAQDEKEDRSSLVDSTDSVEKSEDEDQVATEFVSAEIQDSTNPVAEITLKRDQDEAEDANTGTVAEETKTTIEEKADPEANVADEPVSDITPESSDEEKTNEEVQQIWSLVTAQEHGFVPFAQVLSVSENSPAMQATLKSGDLLVKFGGIVSSTPKCLVAMAEWVQKNVDNSISVVLLRPLETTQDEQFQEIHVALCPRKWEGKGLLGCQLSPFKWPEDESQQTIEGDTPVISTVSTDEDASALVIYDIVPASAAEQAGLLNGDILAGCDGLEIPVNVANLSDIVGYFQVQRPVYFDITRWSEEEQCYRSLRLEISSAEGSLGFTLTSFVEYYDYYSTSVTTSSACEQCYYTTLTTALHAAALSGHVSCLDALLSSLQNGDGGGYSASDYLDWRDEDGRTPLFYACYAGQFECVKYLVRTLQSVSEEELGGDLYGDTVLHAATTSGNTCLLTFLLQSGCAKVDDRNHMRLTCAHVAPNVATLTCLGEECDADLLATDAQERMPLTYACLRNDVESIRYLCTKHPDFVDYADIRGNTPLHVAAWLGLQRAAEVLIPFLPSIALYITNEDGLNVAELARSNGMEDVAVFLDEVLAAADTSVS